MAGINFNPQPMNNWKINQKAVDEKPPKSDDITDFLQTAQGKAFLACLKNNKANEPQPEPNGKRPGR